MGGVVSDAAGELVRSVEVARVNAGEVAGVTDVEVEGAEDAQIEIDGIGEFDGAAAG